MPTTMKKTENLNMRVTQKDKQTLNRAAELEGKSITGFVLNSALSSAETTLKKENKIELNEKDFKHLLRILDKGKEPNKALKEAFVDFSQKVDY